MIPIVLCLVGLTAPQAPAGNQQPPKPPPQYKPYADVITAEAKSQDGMFKVHQVGDKTYFEVPKGVLGRDMLWQAQQKEIPHPLGGPGVHDNRLVRWTRRNNKLFLNGIDVSQRAVNSPAYERGVRMNLPPAIIAAFKIESEGPGDTALIDVSDFLISDPNEFNVGQSWSAALDKNRSYVDKVKAFPENVEMTSVLTYNLRPVEALPGTMSSYARSVGPNASVVMHYSFALLPEKPMMPRYRDPRVGYFGFIQEVFGGPENRSLKRELIARFRLEKRDPSEAVSEPKRPIVFYLSREFPERFREAAIRCVEAWRPAFEQAGFRNAIHCRLAPTEAEDPDWDTEDARYSMIRWNPNSIENAFGLKIADPRSGEIISGQVVFYNNFMGFLQGMYFSQVSHLDPAARRLPFGDELMGKLVQYIITHEVGHAIGLEHNMKASSAFTVEQLRDPKFVAKNDIAPSIMDYARFNYVAQPGDNVPLERKVGAYDRFAIEWGYKPIPEASTSEAERPYLDALASKQITQPELRFGNYLNIEDPTEATEDLSNDPIAATKLGLLNIRRAAKLLVPATVVPGEDYTQTQLTYNMLVYQWRMELDHIVRLVGGVYADKHLAPRGAQVYRPVPAEKQREAVRFLCGPDGRAPQELVSPDISKRLYARGSVYWTIGFQSVILFSLLTESRMLRMLDWEAAEPGKVYTVRELLADMQSGVWSDLGEPRPTTDGYQRQLQRNYLIILDNKLNGANASKTDLMTHGRASLKALAQRIDKAIPLAGDEVTRAHLADCRRQIEQIMKGTSPAVTTPLTISPGARSNAHACFPTIEELPLFNEK